MLQFDSCHIISIPLEYNIPFVLSGLFLTHRKNHLGGVLRSAQSFFNILSYGNKRCTLIYVTHSILIGNKITTIYNNINISLLVTFFAAALLGQRILFHELEYQNTQ